MSKENRGIKISFNSPVILIFSIICLLVLGLGYLTGGASDDLFFCVYKSSFTDPLTYFRFFGHVLGHANWEHFIGNITMILVIGSLLEEKYGSADILLVNDNVSNLTHIVGGVVGSVLGIAMNKCKGSKY